MSDKKSSGLGGVANSIGQEVSRWSRLLRWTVGLGTGASIMALFFRDPNSRQVWNNLTRIQKAWWEKRKLEAGPVLEMAKSLTFDEVEQLKNAIWRTALVYIYGLGLLDIIVCITVESVMMKAIFIFLTDSFLLFSLNAFWPRWAPLALAIATVKGWIDQKEVDSAKGWIGSLWSMFMSGPRTALSEGVAWVFNMARTINQTIFWICVGSMVLSPVPWFQVPVMPILLLPTCFLLMLGTSLWKSQEELERLKKPLDNVRGREVSWVLWACIFYIADGIFMATAPGYFYYPVLKSQEAALVLLAVVVIEAVAAIYIVRQSRQGAVASARSPYAPAPPLQRPFSRAIIGWVIFLAVAVFFFYWFGEQVKALNVNLPR